MPDICYLCLRIPSKEVLSLAHKVWNDEPKIARKMGLEACKRIKQTYHKNPTYFCGKSTRTIIAGLFYYLGQRYNHHVTQQELEKIFSVVTISVRVSFVRWVKLYHNSIDEFRKSYMWFRSGYRRQRGSPDQCMIKEIREE